jgi:hypothetical protein
MKTYTVHLRRHGLDPERDLVLVKEGFAWPAFFLGGLWALAHRLWLTALVLFAVVIAVEVVLVALEADEISHAAISLGIATAVGWIANDLRRRVLARRGYALAGVVAGEDRDTALWRFLEGEPALARDLAQALPP